MSKPNPFTAITTEIEDNRHFFGYYDKLSIPPTPRGNEAQVYKVGQLVKSSPTYTMRNQVGVIRDTYDNNGFVRYIVQWRGMKSTSDCRQSDLELI